MKSSTFGKQTQAKMYKTRKGVKCTYQDYFLNKVSEFMKHVGGSHSERQAKVNHFITQLPENTVNPLWRIKGKTSHVFLYLHILVLALPNIGLDVHRDSPVEVLHVILLGFVKYFWRDAMKRLAAEQKILVTIRISSFDTEGLGLSPLSGKTLVQFAGSLTGRDFRIISQIAPFILFDVLEEHIYETWLALSLLIPLIWQPLIEDTENHLVSYFFQLLIFACSKFRNS